MEKRGFSLLEMIIAISIIAVVIAFSLVAMGTGLQLTKKTEALILATSIAQYEIDYARNIPFPPTTNDRQSEFTSSPRDGTDPPDSGKWCDGDIICNGTNYKDLEFQVACIRYDKDGVSTSSDNETMLRKIKVFVRRKSDEQIILTTSTYISRNGAI